MDEDPDPGGGSPGYEDNDWQGSERGGDPDSLDEDSSATEDRPPSSASPVSGNSQAGEQQRPTALTAQSPVTRKSTAQPAKSPVPLLTGFALIDQFLDGLTARHGGLLKSIAGLKDAQSDNATNSGAASGSYIVTDPMSYVGSSSKQWGIQCVRLVQMIMQNQENPIGVTANWVPLAPVRGNTSIAKGTVVATFVDGHYPTGRDKHAAIFLEFVKGGMRVVDQNLPLLYKGEFVGQRIIRFDNPGRIQNNADEYWVVGTKP